MTIQEPDVSSLSPVVRALARFEGRRLLSSPLFLVGLGLVAFGSGVFVWAAITDPLASWTDDGWTAHSGFLISTIFTMLAVNRAALRDRRGHTVDQHGALPVEMPTRLTGLLSATAWPASILTSFVAMVVGFAALRFGVEIASTSLQLIHHWILVMTLSAFGLALAAWLPNPFVAPIVAFGLYTIHPGEVPAAWQAIWPFADIDIIALAGWHVVYLAGLTLLLAALGQIRFAVGRRQIVTLLVGLLLAVGSLSIVMSQVCPRPGACVL
jgi:hypothetical protein